MKKWRQYLVFFGLLLGIGLIALPATHVSAINVFSQCGASSGSAVCGATSDSASGLVKNVINTLLFVLGMIAIIMIIVGGMRYTTSGGNSQQTKEAKDTIVYALVGLVVAIMAFAIVNFVVQRI